MQKLDDKIKELETLRRLQRENAQHYYHNMQDDYTGNFWQKASEDTQKDIVELQKEKSIIEKWQALEAEPEGKATETKSNTELRALVHELGEDVHAEIDHGECFYERDMLRDFCGTLDKLKAAALRYYVSNKKESQEDAS